MMKNAFYIILKALFVLQIFCSDLDISHVGKLLDKKAETNYTNKPNTNTAQYLTQSTFACSKLTIETLEQGVKYAQS